MSSTMSKDGTIDLSDYPEIIDVGIFEQILEMDDDTEEREFSGQIVQDFFTQADGIFVEMEENLKEEYLEKLSDNGHFMKGSAATLGLIKLQKSFEAIQNYGKGLDRSGNNVQPNKRKSLDDIRRAREDAKRDCLVAKGVLYSFFGWPRDW